MFGLDVSLAHLSDGTTLLVVLGVAMLLGLRHATDPDHLAAVTTLAAGDPAQTVRRAGALGASWGLGHATSLFAFGLPIVLYKAYLPATVQRGAEAAVGAVIVALAVWLLVRWRRGIFRTYPHPHGARTRSARQAYAIGVIHGIGGTAGVGILLIAAIPDHKLALSALALFALCSALSMAVLSGGFGRALAGVRLQRSFDRVAPVLGVTTLAFGVWYVLGALSLAPYFL